MAGNPGGWRQFQNRSQSRLARDLGRVAPCVELGYRKAAHFFRRRSFSRRQLVDVAMAEAARALFNPRFKPIRLPALLA